MPGWVEGLDWSFPCLRDAPGAVICSVCSLLSANIILFFRKKKKQQQTTASQELPSQGSCFCVVASSSEQTEKESPEIGPSLAYFTLTL